MKTLVSKYIKQESLSPMSVRDFCIKHNFYTRGDCTEYSKMLYKAEIYDGNFLVLRDIAVDIIEHSDLDMFEEEDVFGDVVARVMTMLDNECVLVTYKFEEEYV